MAGMDAVQNAADELFARIRGSFRDKDGETIRIADAERVREFNLCADALKKCLRGSGAKIECVPQDEYASIGVIRVSGRRLFAKDPVLFAKATALASNYEIYPKTDGTVVLALTFYGMTKRVEG